MAVDEGLQYCGYEDDARERRGLLEGLEAQAREKGGEVESPHEGIQNTLQRGWYWGSQEFREALLKRAQKQIGNRNYRSSELGRATEKQEALEWMERGRKHFGLEAGRLSESDRSARLAIAWALHARTNQPQKWIAEELGLRSAANVSQQVRRVQKALKEDPGAIKKLGRRWAEWVKLVKNC